MIEIIFTRPMTIYNSSEAINTALFSKAKPLCSPRLVLLNSFNFDQRRCNTSKGFRALFVYCIWWKIVYFLLQLVSLKLRSFVLLFFFRFSIMCRGVFNKTVILVGLAGMKWSCIISYPARPRRIIVKYMYIDIHISSSSVECISKERSTLIP